MGYGLETDVVRMELVDIIAAHKTEYSLGTDDAAISQMEI